MTDLNPVDAMTTSFFAAMELESLAEHNARMQKLQMWDSIVQSRPNGIACPECGKELLDTNPNFALLTSPVQYRVHCSACDYVGTRF